MPVYPDPEWDNTHKPIVPVFQKKRQQMIEPKSL